MTGTLADWETPPTSALTLDRGLTDTTETTRGDRLMPNATCTIEECQRPSKSRGWCNTHYERWRRGNDPTVDRPVYGALCGIEECQRPTFSRGWCATHYSRWRRGNDPTVDPELDAVPTYGAMHKRLSAWRGPAKTHPCTDCGGPACDWSYDHTDPDELTEVRFSEGLLLPYSTDPARYQPLCVSCHRVRDGAYLTARTHCPSGHEYTPENTYRRPDRPTKRVCRACTTAQRANRRAS